MGVDQPDLRLIASDMMSDLTRDGFFEIVSVHEK
jgi:hypothetical protein